MNKNQYRKAFRSKRHSKRKAFIFKVATETVHQILQVSLDVFYFHILVEKHSPNDKTGQLFQKMRNFIAVHSHRRKIRFIEVNAKCRHLKILACKGTLRQVFIRVYRLEIANFLRTFCHVGIFNLALSQVTLYPVAPLFSLVQLVPPPSPL